MLAMFQIIASAWKAYLRSWRKVLRPASVKMLFTSTAIERLRPLLLQHLQHTHHVRLSSRISANEIQRHPLIYCCTSLQVCNHAVTSMCRFDHEMHSLC